MDLVNTYQSMMNRYTFITDTYVFDTRVGNYLLNLNTSVYCVFYSTSLLSIGFCLFYFYPSNPLFIFYTISLIVLSSKGLDMYSKEIKELKSKNVNQTKTIVENLDDLYQSLPIVKPLTHPEAKSIFQEQKLDNENEEVPSKLRIATNQINIENRPVIKPGPGIGLKYLALRYVLIHHAYKFEGIGYKYKDKEEFYRDIENVDGIKEGSLKKWFKIYIESDCFRIIRENGSIINLHIENNEFVNFPDVLELISKARTTTIQ